MLGGGAGASGEGFWGGVEWGVSSKVEGKRRGLKLWLLLPRILQVLAAACINTGSQSYGFSRLQKLALLGALAGMTRQLRGRDRVGWTPQPFPWGREQHVTLSRGAWLGVYFLFLPLTW
jgi:hypothetical protein